MSIFLDTTLETKPFEIDGDEFVPSKHASDLLMRERALTYAHITGSHVSRHVAGFSRPRPVFSE